MYTDTEIEELRERAEKWDLSGRELLERYTPEELGEMYNGAGPDSWIPEAREVLTKAMSLFKPAILIHDVQFAQSDGSAIGFEQAVADWCRNTSRIVSIEFPLFTWRILSRSYRLNMAYWYGVMFAANAAISSPEAKRVWIVACNDRRKKNV